MRARAYIILLCLLLAIVGGCARRTDPAAQVGVTPSVTLDRGEAAGGQVVDARYRWTVAADASPLPADVTVFVHLVDEHGDLLWADDHRPPVPSQAWKGGQVIDYARPVVIPRGLRRGPLSLRIGLYNSTGARLALHGDDAGHQAYRVATLRTLPPGSEPSAVFSEGWHDVEIPDNTGASEWHWSRQLGTILMRNPRRSSTLVLDLDQPMTSLPAAQSIAIRLGDRIVDTFEMSPGQRELRRVAVAAEALGTGEVVSFALAVDPTFVPAKLEAGNGDGRELGIRVFHAYLTTAAE
jgi:hypothetical protein